MDFPPVTVALIDVTSCTLAEAATFADEPLERRAVPSTSGFVGTTLLQEGAAPRLNLSAIINFSRTHGLAVPQNLDEEV